jgi:O-antigen/teichoic acid export membrane protein
MKDFLSYSLPLIPNNISWWVINVSDRTIISIFINLAANGIYAISNKFALIYGGLFGIFNVSWQESASVHIDASDRNAFFSNTLNNAVKLFGSLAVATVSIMPIIFPIMTSAEFNDAYYFIPILIFAAFFNGTTMIYGSIYSAKKLTKRMAKSSVAAAIISIIISLALIPFIGLWAAAISTAVAYTIITVYRHYDTKKYVQIHYNHKILITLLLLFIATCTLYYFNDPFLNILNITIASITFLTFNISLIKKGPKIIRSFLHKK